MTYRQLEILVAMDLHEDKLTNENLERYFGGQKSSANKMRETINRNLKRKLQLCKWPQLHPTKTPAEVDKLFGLENPQ